RRLDVLVEGADPQRPGYVRGTSCRYAPVSFRGHAPALLRRIVPVRATAGSKGVILGESEPETLQQRTELPLIEPLAIDAEVLHRMRTAKPSPRNLIPSRQQAPRRASQCPELSFAATPARYPAPCETARWCRGRLDGGTACERRAAGLRRSPGLPSSLP